MNKDKLFLLGSIVFILMLAGVYVLAQVPGVSHNPLEISCTSDLCIKSTGVGIGTSDPEQELHIFKSGNARLRIQNSNDPSGGYIIRNYNNSGVYSLDVVTKEVGSNGNLNIFGNGNGTITASFDGNVGIGGGLTVSGGMIYAGGGQVVIRNIDNTDAGNIQVKYAYLSGLENRWYSGDVHIDLGTSQFKTCNGPSVCITNAGGVDNANIQVNTIHVSQICLNGVCKTTW